MDSLIFDSSAGNPVRTESPDGGVYRTTVGPAYYESWNNFPEGTKFVSTLNFGNDSLKIARNFALASVKYQAKKIDYFELGNEPTNYNSSRWDNSTKAYVKQWKDWTSQIDQAVNEAVADAEELYSKSRWWASSATTDDTGLHVKPVDIIPAGIDSNDQVGEYSIHSYEFSTCDPGRAAIATIPNILNHTGLLDYADNEIGPSARASIRSGKRWVIGEFNSISCSGNPNVSDVFAQALWNLDVSLIYAVRNASSVHLHQGATLVFQSGNQVNSAGPDGEPGYSTYDILYPRDTKKRGKARALPGFVSQLFLAEAFAVSGTRVQALETPAGLNSKHFAAYAFYVDGKLSKVALINMYLYYEYSTEDHTVTFDFSSEISKWCKDGKASLKRMTAPYVNEKDTTKTTWAGQSFENGAPVGEVDIEDVSSDGIVEVRGSEAVLIFFDESETYGL